MSKTSEISKEDFQSLLNWFSNNAEEAGVEYERIHKGLVRFFRYRGCSDNKTLADETLNRVAKKVDTFVLTDEAKKISICYGFAFNVYREYLRDSINKSVSLNADYYVPPYQDDLEDEEKAQFDLEFDCLRTCMKKLSEEDKYLMSRYFSKEKSEKINLRKKIADKLNITPNALHVRVYRLKKTLKKCMEKCINKKNV